MELPPPHVLLQLDAIIVAQRESADDDADAAFDIESSATSFSEPVEEAAAHAVNAAIRRAGLEGRRKTNPVVDGQLVPRARLAHGHGPRRKSRKRRRDEPAAAPSPRARRRR